MNEKNKWLLFAIPLLILGCGWFIYFNNFEGKFSTEPTPWGSYGTFINSFVTLANVSLFLMFSLLVYRYNRTVNSPILTFKTKIKKKREVWIIKNIGNGPAMNLLVAYKTDANEHWIHPAVKCYSLGKDDSVTLDWIDNPDVIGVYYTDIFKNEFIALVGNDITEISSYSQFKEFTINNFVYTKNFFEPMLNLTSVRLAQIRNLTADSTSTTTTQTTSREG
ncbi:MAG: hypothetical protein JWO92_1063 [Chitinophagaceae bacterium]|nr:hypothetical protein [Chitinophagaceae bacterium]